MNSEIDKKNRKIKQLMIKKTAVNQEMLNSEKAIGELNIQLGRKDIELKILQEKAETNQINKLKDESYQIKLENSSLHSSLEKAEVENQKLIDGMMHGDKEFREIEIFSTSTHEGNKNTVHVIGDSLLQHIKPEWLLNNDIKENEKITCVKHWEAKLSNCQKGEGGQDPKQGLDMNRTRVIKVEGDKEENLSVMIVAQGNILK